MHIFFSTVEKYLVVSIIFIVKGYQYFLSPILGSQCRFYPSCSSYCLICLKDHGLLKGLGLTLIQILKCNPYFFKKSDHL